MYSSLTKCWYCFKHLKCINSCNPPKSLFHFSNELRREKLSGQSKVTQLARARVWIQATSSCSRIHWLSHMLCHLPKLPNNTRKNRRSKHLPQRRHPCRWWGKGSWGPGGEKPPLWESLLSAEHCANYPLHAQSGLMFTKALGSI